MPTPRTTASMAGTTSHTSTPSPQPSQGNFGPTSANGFVVPVAFAVALAVAVAAVFVVVGVAIGGSGLADAIFIDRRLFSSLPRRWCWMAAVLVAALVLVLVLVVGVEVVQFITVATLCADSAPLVASFLRVHVSVAPTFACETPCAHVVLLPCIIVLPPASYLPGFTLLSSSYPHHASRSD